MGKKIIPIILSGGKGTRLWPLSRESYPKQFLSLCGDNDKSLLQQTYERISTIEGVESPIIICNEDHRFLVAEQMREINVIPKSIILEPEGKNTAPAIALGALQVLEEDPESLLLVLSADHIIKNISNFKKVLKEGFKNANENNLITFGIIPDKPETGYGYIESELILEEGKIMASKIKKFIEKPNLDLAKKLVKSKKFTWNSGIFVFKTRIIIDELANYAPKVLNNCKKAIQNSKKDLDFIRVEKTFFSKTPNIPIDIAVMEKTLKGMVIPLDAGWSDIGNWKSLWECEEKDQHGNVIQGKVINDYSINCYLKSESRLLVTIGLKDLIVVDTPDSTLVANKENLENLKSLVTTLDANGHKEGLFHKKIFRPWGSYTSLIERDGWLVKKIEVKPGSKLSLQMHHHRSEHWTVVEGTAKVEIDDKVFILSENQSTYIPLGAKHRLTNPGKINLTLIEVQSGNYIAEDDIVRFEDLYGRNSPK